MIRPRFCGLASWLAISSRFWVIEIPHFPTAIRRNSWGPIPAFSAKRISVRVGGWEESAGEISTIPPLRNRLISLPVIVVVSVSFTPD